MNTFNQYLESLTSTIPNPLETEAEQRHLFDCCDSDDEAFERLDACGIGEILWSKSLDLAYAEWQYFNLK